MLNRSAVAAAALAVAAFGQGCVSLSMLQTARAVPEGTLRSAAGFQMAVMTPPKSTPASSSSTSVFFPVPEAALRYGLGGGRDIGLKAGPFGGQGEFKQELIGDGPVVISLAPSVGFLLASNTVQTRSTTTELVIQLPILFGATLPGGEELIFGPRFVEAVVWQSAGNTSSSANNLLVGGSFAIVFKPRENLRVMPEFNFATKAAGDGPNGGVGFQFGLGFLFGQ